MIPDKSVFVECFFVSRFLVGLKKNFYQSHVSSDAMLIEKCNLEGHQGPALDLELHWLPNLDAPSAFEASFG